MHRFLLFLFLFLSPCLFASPSQKRCIKYLKQAIDKTCELDERIQKIDPNASLETKIDCLKSSIDSYSGVMENLDLVINNVLPRRVRKRKPWQEDMQARAVKQKEVSVRFLNNLKTNLTVLKTISFSEKKLQESNKWIECINNKSAEAESLLGQAKVNGLNAIMEALNNGIRPFQEIIGEISLINDQEARTSLLEWQQHAENSVKKLQQSLREVEENRNATAAIEAACRLVEGGNLKYEQAAPLVHEIYPLNLKEIPGCLKALNTAKQMYEEALLDFKKALELLQPYDSEVNKFFLQKRMIHFEQMIASFKAKVESNLLHQEQLAKLKEQLALLDQGQGTLKDCKKIESILTQLTDCGEANHDSLSSVHAQIAILETEKNEKGLKAKQSITTKAHQKEEDKISEFFKNNSLNEWKKIAINKSTFLEQSLFSTSYPFTVALDAEAQEDQAYRLYLEQFYHFFVQNHSQPSFLNVSVYEDSQMIYKEQIPFPNPSKSDWNNFVTDEGLVSIPETLLKTQFGLSLNLIAVSAQDNDHAFIIKHKAENPDYQFAFSCDNHPLYECSFKTPLPWQLESLHHFSMVTISKPLEKLAPNIVYTSQAYDVQESSEMMPHEVLDTFIEEMKNDPLALAQYVQNEIEFVDPFLLRENSIMVAPKIQRSALNTFLEKQGTPWEQCALLVYLLRKAGYQAKYAEGATLALPTDYVEKLLVTKLPGTKDTLLKYPWVMLFDGNQWIALFPWLKDMAFQEGSNLYSFLPEAYASAEKWIRRYLTNDPKIIDLVGPDGDDTTGVLFVRFLEKELREKGLSLQDVGFHRSINKKQFTNWQDFPRPQISGDFQGITNLNSYPQFFTAAKIEISSQENPHKKIATSWDFPSLFSSYPPTIHFESTKETNHLMYLSQSNHQKTLVLELDPSDEYLDVTIVCDSPVGDLSKTFTISKGTFAVICFNAGGSSPKTISFFGERFINTQAEMPKLHHLLGFLGAVYFDKCNRAESHLADLHKLSRSTILNVGLVKLSPENPKESLDGKSNFIFPQVDMFRFCWQKENESPFNYEQEINLAKRQFSALMCCDGSSNEHQVLREIFNDPYAVSAVKLLQIAHEEHQKKGLPGPGFLTFTQKSLADAERLPIVAQCLYFNHLPGLNLNKIKADAASQWDTASLFLKSKENCLSDQNFSYAYMTPGRVSSKDGDGLRRPSYTGIGTIIIHKTGCLSLIANGSKVMNGGFGSRFSDNPFDRFSDFDSMIHVPRDYFQLRPKPPSFFPDFFSSIDMIYKETEKLRYRFRVFDDYAVNFYGRYSPQYNTKISQFIRENCSFPSMARRDSFLSLSEKDLFSFARLKPDVRPSLKSIYDAVADPVDIVTGAFYVDEMDLDLPGPFPLAVRRNYNNQNPMRGMLGIGWKISLNPFLLQEGDHLFAAEQDGTMINYRFNPESSRWEVFPEDNPELRNHNKKGIGGTANPYHAYIEKRENFFLHGSDGSIRRFENTLLKEWTDVAGNSLLFTYRGNQLIRIENSNGSYLGFCYNYEGRISEAYTTDGRRVYYTYDSQDNLVKVELPNGGDIAYEYDAFHQIVKEVKPHGKILENSYDELGRVIEQFSPNGPQQQMVTTAKFTYGEEINTVTDAAGARSEYKIYQKQIYKITDPEGNQILHSTFVDQNTWFDAETEQLKPWQGKGSYPRSLKSTKDKRGLVTEYLYDEKGNPIEITVRGDDLTGNGDQIITKLMTYDERNLCVVEQALQNKTITHYQADHPYLPKKIERFLGDKLLGYTDFQYNSQGQVVLEDSTGAITLWEYDSRGFPIRKTQKTGTEDPDVVTTFDYNHEGQCIKQVTQDAIVESDYDLMGNSTVSTVYSLSGELISRKYAGYDLNHALTWQMGLDPHDVTYIDYNLAGYPKAKRQLLSKAVLDKNQKIQIEEAGVAYTLFDYDARGNLIKEVDPLGQCTYREYDLLGRVSKVSKMEETTQFSYESGGLISEVISPNGLKTKREYSTNGLLLKELYPDKTEASFKYDLSGRLIAETRNGITTTIEYDDAFQKAIYRCQQKVFKIEEFDSKGHLVALTDSLGSVSRKVYDDLGRLKAEIDPEGCETTWQYLGDSIICISPSQEKEIQRHQAGQVVENQTFNCEGNLTAYSSCDYCPFTHSRKEVIGDLTSTVWVDTRGKPLAIQHAELLTINQYDPCGNCVAVTDGQFKTTENQFDAFSRLIKKTLAGGAVIAYDYDSNSNLISCNLPGDVSWKASYDALGRKISEELQTKGLVSQQWKYAYEGGRLKEAIDPNLVAHIYLYDPFGRVLEEHAGNFSRNYTYDERGLLTSVEQIGEDHTKVERMYDGKGRLVSESVFLNSELLNETKQGWKVATRTLEIGGHQRQFYYLAGHLKQIQTPGITLDYHHDHGGLLTKRSTDHIDVSYCYDASGLPNAITSVIQGKSYGEVLEWNKSFKLTSYESHWAGIQENKVFSYTSQGQLKSINNDEYAFDFDKPGCGVRTKAPNWTIPPEGLDPFGKIIAEICQGKEVNTTYNAFGQVTSRFSDDTQEYFKWDPWGNLIEISREHAIWSASYDALGRRLKTVYKPKDGQELAVISFYDPEKEFDEIRVQYDGKTFWKLGNTQCDAIVDEEGNAVSLVYDALGSLAAVVEPGEIHWNNELASPYGPLGLAPSMEPNLTSFAKAHTWQNRRVDPTGYIWMGARYYDPQGGKFLSRDPVGIPISLDLYSYANGDPINFNDPDGRFASAIYQPIKSFLSGFWDFIGNIGSKLVKLPGQALSLIGHDLIPIPYVKDVIEFGGWCLQGNNPAAYNWTKTHSQLVTHDGNGHGDPHFRHLMFFGIGVDLDACKTRLAQYSETNGGVTVHGLYNATKGFLLDGLEVICQKLGVPVNAQRVAERETRLIMDGMGDYRNCGTLITEAHSQGAETVYNLSSDIKSRMNVNAFGPARILPENEFRRARNYIRGFDPVPLLDPIGLIQGIRNGNVHYMPSSGCPILDHYYDNEKFQEVRGVAGDFFKENYGAN